MAVTVFESVLPATTFTWLCTRAFGAGVHTVTDGFVELNAQGAAKASEWRRLPTARTATSKQDERIRELRTEKVTSKEDLFRP
jgi:hypothetical protein